MLSEAGRLARFSVIAPERVAGQSAAGLRVTPGDPASTVARVTPGDPASTVGRVDIWANPSSGLPLMVEVFGRGSPRPALESLFFQVSPWHPDLRVLTPARASGTGFTVTRAGSLAGALRNFFRQPVFWRDIQRGFGIQALYVVVFLAAAWANFSTKDITA